MTTKDIQQLLDRYFDGETSLEEEASLKQYFQGTNIDPSLRVFQPLFRFLDSERQATISPSFNEKLMNRIQGERRLHLRRILAPVARIAAVVVVLIGVAVFFTRKPEPAEAVAINWEQYEPQSDAEAIAEATAALKLLGEKLNGSAKTASKELDKIEKSATVFK